MKSSVFAAVLLAAVLFAGAAAADEAADIDAAIFEAMKQGAVDKGAGDAKADDLFAVAQELSYRNTPEAKKRAVSMMAQAAAMNYAPAQRELAEMYLRGELVKRDEKKAVALLSKAAEQGDEDAMGRLGWIYANDRKYGQKYVERLEKLVRKFGHDVDLWYFVISRPAG